MLIHTRRIGEFLRISDEIVATSRYTPPPKSIRLDPTQGNGAHFLLNAAWAPGLALNDDGHDRPAVPHGSSRPKRTDHAVSGDEPFEHDRAT